MVDYTTSKSGGSGLGLVLAAGFIVVVLLYALYAGSSRVTPATGAPDAPAALEGVPDATAPATLPTE